MTEVIEGEDAGATAERLLGFPLVPSLGPGEPEVGRDFLRIGMENTFGGVWQRPGLDLRSPRADFGDDRSRSGAPLPLGGQLKIALNCGVTKEEIVELFIHLQAYAGASRAAEGYHVAKAIFAERA